MVPGKPWKAATCWNPPDWRARCRAERRRHWVGGGREETSLLTLVLPHLPPRGGEVEVVGVVGEVGASHLLPSLFRLTQPDVPSHLLSLPC